MSVDDVRKRIEAADARRKRRAVVLVACGATIVPSWLAVIWLLPDFRLMAAVGLIAALWILTAAYRTRVTGWTAADVTGTTSVAFYRTLLERERAQNRSVLIRFLAPALLSTGAILLTFARSDRFEHTPLFFGVMAWIVVGTGVSIAVGIRRSRREAVRVQQELDALDQ